MPPLPPPTSAPNMDVSISWLLRSTDGAPPTLTEASECRCEHMAPIIPRPVDHRTMIGTHSFSLNVA
eukprot:9485412-Pyramimonas_sp.AAC.1